MLGRIGALGRVQAGKEVLRLVNHLLDNAYKLIGPVGRDRNTFLELNICTLNTCIQKARKGTKEHKTKKAGQAKQVSHAMQTRPDKVKQGRMNASKAGQDHIMQERCRRG